MKCQTNRFEGSTRRNTSWRLFAKSILGSPIAVTAKVLGIPKASLSNWVRLSTKGMLSGAGDKPVAVTAEQMELARLRAEVARLRMERDIAKKAAAYFAQDTLRGTPGFTK
jgi:transposase